MTTPPAEFDILYRHASAAIDGVISDAEFADLQARLTHSEAAREFFVRYMYLQMALARVLREPSAEEVIAMEAAPEEGSAELAVDASVFTSPPPPLPSAIADGTTMPGGSPVLDVLATALGSFVRPALWTFLGCGMAFVMYVVVITWGMLGDKDRDLRLEARGARDEARGENGQATDFASQTSNRKPQASDPQPKAYSLQPTAYSLQPSQHRRLTLAQGVTLLVEGPAQWSIDGKNRATLTRGSVVAHVPPRAIGFTLKTPTTTIVDLGTEFGVTVDDQGQTQTQVFRGIVEVATSGAPTPSGMPTHGTRRLEAGEAVAIDADGRIADIAPRMVRPAALDKIASAEPSPPPVDAKPQTNVAGPPQAHLRLWLRGDAGVEQQEVAPGESRVVRWQNQVQPHDAATDLVLGNHAKVSGHPAVPGFNILSNAPVEALASVGAKEYPVVRFNGVSYLQNPDFAGSDSLTIYLVAKSNGAPGKLVEGRFTAYHTLAMFGALDFSTPGTAWAQILEWRNGVAGVSGTSLGANFPDKARDIASPSAPQLESHAWQIVELRKIGEAPGLTQFYFNGHYITQVGGMQSIGKGLFLGGFAFGGLNGDIAEVLIYDTPLYETDRQLVEGLLAWKYGLQTVLPRGHLYFDVNPSLPPIK